ncbi:MAG: hypothetical protein M1816_006881 [Peltula sp. TS41687]|nr:MAG: hypothetical protein M1816_006881 [Peltula sp. TS41687]
MADGSDSDAHSVAEQLARLEEARKLVLGDAAYYGQIVQGILPIIGAQARVEVRRWGTDFLAEAFASPNLGVSPKQSLSLVVLDTLKDMLANPGQQDSAVLKSVLQVSASIYPLVFRHIIAKPNDSPTWEKMTAIKSGILKMWDSAAGGVRICCVKFVQRVILVQTAGPVADPRRPDQTEVSLTIVPRDHASVALPNLEAEASGLLDRDALVVNATLNCLGALIRSRPSISNKIITAVLNFNPLQQAKYPLTSKQKVMIKSMERTTKALLVNVNKQNPNGPLAPRIHQYIERLIQSRMEMMDEGSRKRGLPVEPTDGLDQSKRVRLGAEVPDKKLQIPPLPPGPISVAQLFTLTPDTALSSFDVKQIPIEMVVQIALPVIYRLSQGLLDQAVGAVRSRIASISQNFPQQQQLPPPVVSGGGGGGGGGETSMEEEDDDYEPEFQPAEDAEQISNKLDSAGPPSEPEPLSKPMAALKPFRLPQPPPLSEREIAQVSQEIITRAFQTINGLEEPGATTKKPEAAAAGFNRLAASNLDRNAWITLITRIATRAPSGLEEEEEASSNNISNNNDGIKKEDSRTEDSIVSHHGRHRSLLVSSTIRESLYLYILEDFRRRIDTAIVWLNEEWYNDRIQRQQFKESAGHYEGLALKILDGILPYLDARDKLFTRFVSELPGISPPLLDRVKSLARDPERVGLAVNTLHYLILFRPPAREICLDALEDLWRNYEDARHPSAKLLQKWRPHVVAAPAAPVAAAAATPAAAAALAPAEEGKESASNPSSPSPPSPSPTTRDDASNNNNNTNNAHTDGDNTPQQHALSPPTTLPYYSGLVAKSEETVSPSSPPPSLPPLPAGPASATQPAAQPAAAAEATTGTASPQSVSVPATN